MIEFVFPSSEPDVLQLTVRDETWLLIDQNDTGQDWIRSDSPVDVREWL